jgi:TatD DNase family protein
VVATFIDTHAHLDDEQFALDLPAVLDRATAAGVTRIVTIATTAPSSLATVELASQYPSLYASIGIQPNHVAEAAPDAWDQVVSLQSSEKIVAIGETGLDRHWDYTPFPLQEEFFARHLDLARRKDLAVVIHCREAEADVVRMLREAFNSHGPIRGVMHSFTGDWHTAEACLGMGLHISIAGMVTYKNGQALREVVSRVPLDRLLVETDSPYLSPVPLRGKRNEPGNLIHTARCLADLHQIDFEILARRTTENALKLFKIS